MNRVDGVIALFVYWLVFLDCWIVVGGLRGCCVWLSRPDNPNHENGRQVMTCVNPGSVYDLPIFMHTYARLANTNTNILEDNTDYVWSVRDILSQGSERRDWATWTTMRRSWFTGDRSEGQTTPHRGACMGEYEHIVRGHAPRQEYWYRKSKTKRVAQHHMGSTTCWCVQP